MKGFMKKTTALLLTLVLLSGCFSCLALGSEKEYLDYNSYVLLGDSVASGWSDVEDRETRFVRVEDSYGAYVADDLGLTDSYYPMACIGFRTVEMRYIFEEDFEADRFLYYSIDKELMDTVHAPAMRKAVAETDLITLNIGGNDWGSFLGWHVFEEMDKIEDKNEEFLKMAEDYLQVAGTDENTIDSIIDIAALCGALPQIVQVLPGALKTGLENFFINWNYMIEDIYALNPDVTLLVIGMFDTSLQDNGNGESDSILSEADGLKLSVGQMIVDIANKPMIEGAKKYGYTFIDTKGTLCEKQHPSKNGHRFIADRILEALPDARFPFTDVAVNSDSYKAIEYLHRNGIMDGISATEFAPEEALTAKVLSDALYNASGLEGFVNAEDEAEINRLTLATTLFRAANAQGFTLSRFVGSVSLMFNVILGAGPMKMGATVTRAEGAGILLDYINL